MLTAVLEAGAEDVNDLDDSFEVICEPGDLVAVRTALQDAGIDYESAEASFQPSVTVPVDLDGARKVMQSHRQACLCRVASVPHARLLSNRCSHRRVLTCG